MPAVPAVSEAVGQQQEGLRRLIGLPCAMPLLRIPTPLITYVVGVPWQGPKPLHRSALVQGFTSAFVVGAGIAAVGIVAALTLIRSDELEQAPEQLQPVLDLAA